MRSEEHPRDDVQVVHVQEVQGRVVHALVVETTVILVANEVADKVAETDAPVVDKVAKMDAHVADEVAVTNSVPTATGDT